MGLIEINNPIEGALGPLRIDGAPSAGASNVQTITFADTWGGGDTFKLNYNGEVTADISWSGTNGTLTTNIKNGLNALEGIGADGVSVAVDSGVSGIGTWNITFADKAPHPAIEVEEATVAGDGTVSVEETTPGVSPDMQGAVKGALLVDTTNAKLYINTGTPGQPAWTVVGTQS